MKKIIVALFALQLVLSADFKSISPDELIKLQKSGAPVIDIRTPGEWRETGVVPGSHKLMFFDERGRYDLDRWMSQFQQIVKDPNQPFVLVCRTASRTKVVGNFLSKQAGYKKVRELAGGITKWIRSGKKVEK